MIDKTTNSLWHIILSKKEPLITNKPYLFDIYDFYGRPPYFRFRFKDHEKDSLIYKELADLVQGFVGNLKWCMTTRPEVKNYVIIPQMFVEYLSDITVFDKSFMKEKYGDNYYELFDQAADDIVAFANLLEKWIA